MRIRHLAAAALAVVFVLSAVPASFAAAPVEYPATFEGGVVPAGFQTSANSGADFAVVDDPAFAHGGEWSLQQRLLPSGTSQRSSDLAFVPPAGDYLKYQVDGWVYCAQTYGWGMCSTPFYLTRTGGSTLGMHLGYNVDGSLGYINFAEVVPTWWGRDVRQQTWHHIVVTYDRVAGTEDVMLDGAYLIQGVPVGTQPVESIHMYATGGYSAGNALTQYLDDVVIRLWPALVPARGVRIDVKPGTPVATFSPGSHGVFETAILSDDGFDATSVVRSSVRLAGAAAQPGRWRLRDVDRDGRSDLVLWFRTEDLKLPAGTSPKLVLTGTTVSGQSFEGSETVRLVGPARSRWALYR